MGKDFSERIETRAEDRTILSAGVVRPEGEPKAVILAGHAMMTGARSLDRPLGKGLASLLASHGYLVVAADFRGHGRSGTRAARGGRWSYDDLVFQDLPAFVKLAGELAPGKKRAVVGQSLMGHVCAAHMGLNPGAPIDALVALSSNMWMRRQEPSKVLRLRKDLQMLAARALTTIFGYFPGRWMRIGSEDESAAVARQLDSCYFNSFWGTQDGAIDYHAGLANIDKPVLVVRGKGDTISCTSLSIRRFHQPVRDVSFWEVGRGDHGLDFEPGHMSIVTDNRSAPLWTALVGWLDGKLGVA